MSTKINRAITLGLGVVVLFAHVGCSKPSETTTTVISKATPTIVRFGTHWVAGADYTYRDDITGSPVMSPEEMVYAEKATQKVLEELNVQIQWVQYSSDVREELLRSVLAGDPVCDLANLWGGSQGTILGQNVMQDLAPYADIFTSDPDTAWMFLPPVFGHNYFVANGLEHITCWPLVFNINYIERIDALKENGQTVYPTDLYKQGKWTWSVFEDYLDKVNTYFRNTPSPVRPDVPIKAYQTDYRFTTVSLLHTAGQAIYGGNGIMVRSPESIETVEYITRLVDRGLMMSVRYGETDVVPGWTWNGGDFGNGETVFTDMVRWLPASASNGLASRGESMGIVPFPRPDDMPFGDPQSQMANMPSDTYCILKGVSPEHTRLTLEAYKLYYSTIYKEKAGGSDKVLDYLEKTAEANAVAQGYDIFHEKIGQDILDIYSSYCPPSPNEFGDLLGIMGPFTESIVGQSIYGFDGSPRYAVNVEQKYNLLTNALASTEAAIASGKATDNIQPTISATSSIAVAQGTDPATVNFGSFITITDNVDGAIDLSKAMLDYSSPDYSKVGVYQGSSGLHVVVKDAAGNERKSDLKVVVYDGANKQPPVITPKVEIPAITVGADIPAVSSYIDTAVDKDGIDVKERLSADTSAVDTATPGIYDVPVSVTDFAGNAASVTLQLTVK